MIKCEECGKEFKTTQALGGHMRFVHGIKTNKQAPLFPPKRFITDADLAEALSVIAEAVGINAKKVDELQTAFVSLLALQPEDIQAKWNQLLKAQGILDQSTG